MKRLLIGVLVGLAGAPPAQADHPPLGKLAVYTPRETNPLKIEEAHQAALRFMRADIWDGWAMRVYACERRTRFVVDCDGDMLAASCYGDLDFTAACPIDRRRVDTIVYRLRVRSRLSFHFVHDRRGPQI